MSDNPFEKYNHKPSYLLPGENEAESLERIESKIKSTNPPQSRVMRWPLWLAAACILLFIGAFFFWPKNNSGDFLAEKYFEPFPNYYAEKVRGENEVMSQAFEHYDKNNFEAAVVQFQKATSLDNIEKLYFSIALQATDQWKESNEVLLESPVKNDTQYREVYQWHLALSWLHEKDYEKAIEQLKIIIRSGEDFAEEAKDLMNQLE